MLCAVLDRPRSYLFAYADTELEDADYRRFFQWLARRLQGEPIAYITGRREFWSLSFAVSPAVLVPRPETECLVERILALDLPEHAEVVDAGTGSGAIAIALASERPAWHCSGLDASAAALAVARNNATNLLPQTGISLLRGDWLEAIASESLDLVVANPPYIAEDDEHLACGDLPYEPASALVSGSDGLDALRIIAAQAVRVLKTGGYLVVEHGWQQQQEVVAIFTTSGFTRIETGSDLAGTPRFVLAQRG